MPGFSAPFSRKRSVTVKSTMSGLSWSDEQHWIYMYPVHNLCLLWRLELFAGARFLPVAGFQTSLIHSNIRSSSICSLFWVCTKHLVLWSAKVCCLWRYIAKAGRTLPSYVTHICPGSQSFQSDWSLESFQLGVKGCDSFFKCSWKLLC